LQINTNFSKILDFLQSFATFSTFWSLNTIFVHFFQDIITAKKNNTAKKVWKMHFTGYLSVQQ
jgi:hypothetical protein